MYSTEKNAKGFTLITTLILLCLLSALSIGLLMMVNTENKVGGQDVQSNYTFHAAEGGIEKMTNDLADQLGTTLAPNQTLIQNLATNPGPPSITGITFPNPGTSSTSGYSYTPTQVCTGVQQPDLSCTAAGNLYFTKDTIKSGQWAQLNALISPVQLQATAQGMLGDEVTMVRDVEIALIPVFQFGMFSDADLSFYAGPNFGFGGRVHTNGDLYVAEGAGSSLTFQDKVSAYGNVVRGQLANGNPIGNNSSTGNVYIPNQANGCTGVTPPTTGCVSLTSSPNDGSVSAGPSSSQNASWQTVSLTTFKGFIIDGDNGNTTYGTGATNMTLPFMNGASSGSVVNTPQQYEIIRRPPLGGDNSQIGPSRLYNEAQIRVLLSDDPTELPCGDPSTPPPCAAGSTDPDNVRLANMNDPENNDNFSHGVPQTSMANFADGGTPELYFATANSAIPDSAQWSSSSNTLVSDWAVGPWYSLWKSNASIQTIWDPTIGAVSGSHAPYMDPSLPLDATNWYGMKAAPPSAYLALCTPPTGALGYTPISALQYSTKSATTPPTFCPNSGAYPYYNLNSAGNPVQNGANPPLTLPVPQSGDTLSTANQSAWNLLDGYLRIEYEDANGNYHPVTREWLKLGFARDVQPPTSVGGNDVSPNAILILQQLADRNGDGTVDATGTVPTSLSPPTRSGRSPNYVYTYTMIPGKPPEVTTDSTSGSFKFGDTTENAGNTSATQYNWYPINFYDAREGESRDTATGDNSCTPAGIMNAVELDVGNLKQWLAGTIGTSGASVNSSAQNGYILYFSDRRGMIKNPNGTGLGTALTQNQKTGDSGLEDVINSANANGMPTKSLEPPFTKSYSPEDTNLNGVLDEWGTTNLGLGLGYTTAGANYTTLTSVNNYINSGETNPDPYMTNSRIASCSVAQGNWVSGARHVLKLVDGTLGNVPLSAGGGGGFTVAAENPVYVQGDYNSNPGDATWGGGSDQAGEAASSIIADSVTLLSNAWQDWNSILKQPTTLGNRTASDTYYRMAIAAGKTINFQYPGYGKADFGTDGGVHNFLRYLENWGCCSVHYKGSIASLYYSTYNTGIFKCCNVVYGAPGRNYFFDTDFNQLSGLPPGTPMFRDIDNLWYRQNFNPCTVGANNKCSN